MSQSRGEWHGQHVGSFKLNPGKAEKFGIDKFPLGELWDALSCEISIPFTVANDDVAAAIYQLAVMELVPNIKLKATGGIKDTLINAPAKALMFLDSLLHSYAPQFSLDGMDGTDGNYNMRMSVFLPFGDPTGYRREDTGLPTDMIKTLELSISLANAAEAMRKAGAADYSIGAAECNVEVIKQAGNIDPQARPKWISKIEVEGGNPIDLSAETVVKLTREEGRKIKRLLLWTGNKEAAADAGNAFSGDGSDKALASIAVVATGQTFDEARQAQQVKSDGIRHFAREAGQAGLYGLDYTRTGSQYEGIDTNRDDAGVSRGKLQLEVEAGSAPAAGKNFLSVVSHTTNPLA